MLFEDRIMSISGLKEPYPAWTAIGVSELIKERTLHDIRIIAKRG